MGFSVLSNWFAVLSCLLCLGGEVKCDCTEENLQIEGGNYKLTKQLDTGSMLIYNCPEGYYPYPALIRLCQPNGSWSPPPMRFNRQRCKLVECPDPNVLECGDVSPPQEKYFVGNETTYECYSGHTMQGSSRRVCLPNGKWSGSTPICSRDSGDDCADPGIPAGASRTGNMFGISDRVKYCCNGNLFLVGSSERVCQANGYWTGKEPACYYKHTYDTAFEVSEAFGSAVRDRLTYLEQIGDRKIWTSKIQIPEKRRLNIYIAMDISQSIEEKHIVESKETVIKLITKISSFTVSPNYEVFFFTCEIFEVANILDKNITLSNIISEMENFQLRGRTAGKDLNNVFKIFLERMAVIKLRVGEQDFKEHHHILIVFTDGAYNIGGSPSPTVAKIKDMIYLDGTSEGESQSREEYLDIYIFGIGAEIYDEDLQPLTAGTSGRHYFRMKDISNLRDTLDNVIDEEKVQGLCGLHKDHATANKTDREIKRKLYPWMAFVYVQTSDGSKKKCLGSLVNPQFVLTAAHCFPFGVVPEDVRVEIDDGHGKVKSVKKFIIHPNYDVRAKVNLGVQEFYDYNVALIQLKEDVHISSTVGPICIPCTQQTSDALQLGRGSTCSEQEQLLLKNHLEKLTFLTRTDNIVDEKDVSAKLGDNRDECIRHASQAPGITTSDPKDVVTDNFLCTGGRTPLRDHIACTGDGGGAVFKNYEHRTIQIALVSWGTTVKCAAGGVVESDETSRDFHINLFKVVPFLKSILGNDNQDEFAPLQFLES